jgi:TRAP-type C4-dicarboxylate transport system substrate-binding protein
MNRTTFVNLNDEQQQALLDAAAEAEAYYLEKAKEADARATEVFRENGVEIAEMTEADFEAWREIAAKSSYRSFVEETPNGEELLDMALAVE